jgi:hypothetical protein
MHHATGNLFPVSKDFIFVRGFSRGTGQGRSSTRIFTGVIAAPTTIMLTVSHHTVWNVIQSMYRLFRRSVAETAPIDAHSGIAIFGIPTRRNSKN